MPFDRFERQMRWLADRYDVLSLRHLAQRVACGGSLRGAAAITFDDGYAGVFEHAVPLLRAMRMPATVFVVANAPGKRDGFWWDHPAVIDSLTPERRQRWLDQLQGDGDAILSEVDGRVAALGPSYRAADWSVINGAVSQGIDVGVHSASHRALPTLSDDELEYEVSASREVIHRATNVWPQFFAYPYGLSDARTCAAVRRAGYLGGLGLETGLNDMTRDTSCWRRVNVPAGISLSAFDAWAAGLCLRRSR
jgi:peptidoglycan/xylan/chitin deacetylase (PgdA/CDA1 family)